MKLIKAFLFLYLTLSCFLLYAKNNEVSLELKGSEDFVPASQPFAIELDLTLSGDIDAPDEKPLIQWPKNFSVQEQEPMVSQMSQLMSSPQGMQFIKKKMIKFSYLVTSLKEGSFSIPPVQIGIGGQKYKSNSITIKVNNRLSKNQNPSQNKKQNNRQRGNPFGGLFDEEDEEDSLLGQLLQNQNPFLRQQQDPSHQEIPKKQIPQINANEAFFVRAEVDKTTAYIGEQIFVNWYLYTRGEIYQLDRLKFPELKNFWKEDVEPAPNLIYENEIVNGTMFRKALLASYAIFPIKDGTLAVDEYKIRAQVAMPVPGFGGFSFGKPYVYSRSSERIPITVMELPESGKPPTFSGAVGIYDIQMTVDQQSIVQWKPFNLRVRFEGEGNAKLIDQPDIKFPDSFDAYDVKTDAKFFKSGKSYKEFIIQLVPKVSGEITIPPVELSYFDTQTRQYTIRASQSLVINVTPAEKPKNYTGLRVQVGDENKLENIILPELRKKPSESQFYWLKGKLALVYWLSLEILLVLILIVTYKILSRKPKDGSDLKTLMHLKEEKIKKLLQKNQLRSAATESLNLISKILNGVTDENLVDAELFKIIENLTPSMRREVGDDLLKISDRWQILAFAPEEAWGELKNENKIAELLASSKKALEKLIEIAFESKNLSDSTKK